MDFLRFTSLRGFRDSRRFSNGETRTRTGDTTIFSRVLYQLSYLAPAQKASVAAAPAADAPRREE
jgi:hypothetical protein